MASCPTTKPTGLKESSLNILVPDTKTHLPRSCEVHTLMGQSCLGNTKRDLHHSGQVVLELSSFFKLITNKHSKLVSTEWFKIRPQKRMALWVSYCFHRFLFVLSDSFMNLITVHLQGNFLFL